MILILMKTFETKRKTQKKTKGFEFWAKNIQEFQSNQQIEWNKEINDIWIELSI